MKLTEEQSTVVCEWIEQGASLSDVQKNLLEKFGLSLTYMDVRFLVDDLNVQLSDRKPAHFASQELKKAAEDRAAAAAKQASAVGEDDFADDEAGEGVPVGGGNVSVSLDKIMRPGALVSGSVTFSDGVTALWHVDQMGRLGMTASKAGYQPTKEDILAFQMELQRMM